MNEPSQDDAAHAAETERLQRETRIAISCGDPALAQRYAEVLNRAGYPLAAPATAENLVSVKSLPGVIDLLVCDVDDHRETDDPLNWQAVVERTQPTFGAIAVTRSEDPRWIVKCMRRGAASCHLASDEDDDLVELVTESLHRHQSGLANVRTAEERRSARLAARLRGAIASEDIDVHFQPIVNCSNWLCERVESLARWTDSDLGSVTPTEFIATAEDEGLVEELGRLILRKSLASLAAVRARGHNPLYSVNVSRRQFNNPYLVKEYAQIVRDFGEDPRRIIIEVTETARFDNDTLAISLMKDFIAAGFALAVDDFGTGESSFIQMSHVAYSELKIDRSLVSCIFEPSGLSIMQSIIAMAKSLNMHLVAEGVEDLQTAELLKKLEIDFCQGYYFGRPMPQEALIAFLDENRGDGARLRPANTLKE